jgi:hypothetical protein
MRVAMAAAVLVALTGTGVASAGPAADEWTRAGSTILQDGLVKGSGSYTMTGLNFRRVCLAISRKDGGVWPFVPGSEVCLTKPGQHEFNPNPVTAEKGQYRTSIRAWCKNFAGPDSLCSEKFSNELTV